MALSGYTEEKKSLWRDRCLSLCKQVRTFISKFYVIGMNGTISNLFYTKCEPVVTPKD